MAQTEMASAVVVPDAEDAAPTNGNSLKRRQSEVSEQENESKRQRISPGKNPPDSIKDDANGEATVADSVTTQDKSTSRLEGPQRKSSKVDEKQRSKRLFGALLGNLNQPGDRTAKRRQEIESRRKAELQRQDDERVEDRQRRQEKLAELRRKEQIKIDEQAMHTRHRNLLNTANFLQTETEPRVYYRPWQLRPDEEDRIGEQVRDAEAQIEQELDAFYQQHGRSDAADRRQNSIDTPTSTRKDVQQLVASPDLDLGNARTEEVGNALSEENQARAKSTNDEESKPAEVSDLNATDKNTNSDVHLPKGNPNVDVEKSKVEGAEEDEDHVVEGDEDTVIY